MYTCFAGIILADGPNIWSGRVEVFSNGQYGTVNKQGFDDARAQFVCEALFKDLVHYQGKYTPE